MAKDGPRHVKGGKGNWYVHQRGAAPVAYPSRKRAKNAAKSLRNARVRPYYQSSKAYNGKKSVSDDVPGNGCALVALALAGGVLAVLGGAVAGVASLVG